MPEKMIPIQVIEDIDEDLHQAISDTEFALSQVLPDSDRRHYEGMLKAYRKTRDHIKIKVALATPTQEPTL